MTVMVFLLTRAARLRFGGVIAGALLGFQPTYMNSTANLVQQSNALMMRSIPTIPAQPVVVPDQTWVPDRWISTPTGELVHVPAHWEQRISATQMSVPPLVISHPASGAIEIVPPGSRLPVESRAGP